MARQEAIYIFVYKSNESRKREVERAKQYGFTVELDYTLQT